MNTFHNTERLALHEPLFSEAGDLLFLTLRSTDRVCIATTIERLINVLDELEGDSDFEPSFAGFYHASPEMVDLELDDSDHEHSLGWGQGTQERLHVSDEREEENEHGGDINDEPQDWDEKEPFMGSGETWGQGPKLNGMPVDPSVQCLDDVSDANDCDAWYRDGRYYNTLEFDSSGYIHARNALRKTLGKPVLKVPEQPYAERATRLSDGAVFRTFVVPEGFIPNRVQNQRDADRCFQIAPGVVRVGF